MIDVLVLLLMFIGFFALGYVVCEIRYMRQGKVFSVEPVADGYVIQQVPTDYSHIPPSQRPLGRPAPDDVSHQDFTHNDY